MDGESRRLCVCSPSFKSKPPNFVHDSTTNPSFPTLITTQESSLTNSHSSPWRPGRLSPSFWLALPPASCTICPIPGSRHIEYIRRRKRLAASTRSGHNEIARELPFAGRDTQPSGAGSPEVTMRNPVPKSHPPLYDGAVPVPVPHVGQGAHVVAGLEQGVPAYSYQELAAFPLD